MPWFLLVRAVHVSANLFWIGSIVAIALILPSKIASARDRGALGTRLYRSLATPSFGVSFLAGTLLLLSAPGHYFVQTHVMHAKLPLALGVVLLHHWIGRKAKLMARGETSPPGSLPAILLVVGAVGAAILALLKPF